MLALFALELQAQGLFQRSSHAGQRRELQAFDAGLRRSRVRSKEPCHVFRRSKRGGMQHYALEKLDEPRTVDLVCLAGRSRRLPELPLAIRQPVGFENGGLTVGILSHQNEVAIVGDEDLPVPVPILGDLVGFSGDPGIVLWWA